MIDRILYTVITFFINIFKREEYTNEPIKNIDETVRENARNEVINLSKPCLSDYDPIFDGYIPSYDKNGYMHLTSIISGTQLWQANTYTPVLKEITINNEERVNIPSESLIDINSVNIVSGTMYCHLSRPLKRPPR